MENKKIYTGKELYNMKELTLTALNTLSSTIYEYIVNYFEEKKQDVLLTQIRFSNNNPILPIKIYYKKEKGKEVATRISPKELKTILTSNEKIKKYNDLLNKFWRIGLEKLSFYSLEKKAFKNITFCYDSHYNHQSQYYTIDMTYKDDTYRCHYKNYNKLLNLLKEYELLELEYSDELNKNIKLKIYKSNEKNTFYKDGLKLSEIQDTFEKANLIINKLIIDIANDFLLPFTDEKDFSTMFFIPMPYFLSDIFSERVPKKLQTPLCILYQTITHFREYYPKEKVKKYIFDNNIDIHNIKLFEEFYQILSTFEGMVYKTDINTFQSFSRFDYHFSFFVDEEKKRYILEENVLKITDDWEWLKVKPTEKTDKEGIKLLLKNKKTILYSHWEQEFSYLVELVNKYYPFTKKQEEKIKYTDKIKITTKDFFDEKEGSKIKKLFLNNDILDLYDLSNINFDHKNISGLDISHNPEAHINFDKIKKDISNCNFNGYDLSKVTLRDFNIKDADLRNTKATIDLSTCAISFEGKMNPGTLLDEENTLLYGNKALSKEEIDALNIKIYKKEGIK